MILFDNESTDLLKPDVADLAAQPHIIEFAAVKVDAKYKVIDKYEALLKPGAPLDEETHKKITGLTNADLADSPTFIELVDEIAEFFLGERIIVAHNLAFDIGLLQVELRRIGRDTSFPFPPQQICTVERTKHLRGHRLKMTDLYEMTMKKKLKQEHRAMSDVMALLEIVKTRKIS